MGAPREVPIPLVPSSGSGPGNAARPRRAPTPALPGTSCRCAAPAPTSSGARRTCTRPPGTSPTLCCLQAGTGVTPWLCHPPRRGQQHPSPSPSVPRGLGCFAFAPLLQLRGPDPARSLQSVPAATLCSKGQKDAQAPLPPTTLRRIRPPPDNAAGMLYRDRVSLAYATGRQMPGEDVLHRMDACPRPTHLGL